MKLKLMIKNAAYYGHCNVTNGVISAKTDSDVY